MSRMSPNLKRYLLLQLEISESEDDCVENLFEELDTACEALTEIELDLVNAIWSYEIKIKKIEEIENG